MLGPVYPACTNSFNTHHHSVKCAPLLFPYDRQEYRGPMPLLVYLEAWSQARGAEEDRVERFRVLLADVVRVV